MDCLFLPTLAFRQVLVQKLQAMDEDLLDHVPEGYNNNIRWHAAHLVVTPSLLTYRLAGVETPLISQGFIDSAKKGSNHDDFSLNEDFGINHICELLIETIKQTQRDFDMLQEQNFNAYETSTGFIIDNVASAMGYSNVHDGMHFGTIMSMTRAIEIAV
jgi:hypothetical protein